MQTLTFYNNRGTIEINQIGDVKLMRIEGVSGITTSPLSISSPETDGSEVILDTDGNVKSYLTNRNITITAAIKKSSLTLLNQYKRTLVNIMSPKIPSKLKYSNETYEKELDVVVELTPSFSQTDNYTNFQVFFVSLIAHNPFWKDISDSNEILAISTPLISFPLVCEPTFALECDGENRVAIDNIGDVDTPVEIYFYGPATNPKVINETTGEFIEVTKILLSGESLYINTKKGSKQVLYNNGITETNAFSLIDIDSTFWQLKVGENIITYEATAGIETASMRVIYKNNFIGL
jgi:hypothetical protein